MQLSKKIRYARANFIILDLSYEYVRMTALIICAQTAFREAGCLVLLAKLVTHPRASVKLAAITTLGNMALNSENQKELKVSVGKWTKSISSNFVRSLTHWKIFARQDTIPKLISLLKQNSINDELALSLLSTLTNFAVLPDFHSEFYPVLPKAYELIEKKNAVIKLQALKLLINLSCNDDMVPSLLAAQVRLETYFW